MNDKYKTRAIIGMQWGDEGKGKITDYLSQHVNVVVRFQGGNNAGHSIQIKNKKFALNHLPSGILNSNIINVMAQGMVINPEMLIKEIKNLKTCGIDNFKLIISNRSNIIMPYHLQFDKAYEKMRSSSITHKKIGTTQKGIGPAYEDKISRIGIRFGDFINKETFMNALKNTIKFKNKQLQAFNLKTFKTNEIFDKYYKYAKKLKKYAKETGIFLEKKIKEKRSVIFEGAQGVMLCLDNGTYPYVTSSSPTASNAPLGSGLNPHYIAKITGVVKAYSTRVGEGYMPTELEIINPDLAQKIRQRGNEFGVVSGRPRRIGWLDIVALKHAIRVSGATDIALTLIDVLTGLHEIKIGYIYTKENQEISYIPASIQEYQKCKPKYIVLKGWKEDITNVKLFKNLPKETKEYIKKIESIIGVPIKIISVGPKRSQTIEVN